MVLYPEAVIMVFCKAPIPGQVKTRLIPTITAEEAAQLHCELTELTLRTATQTRLCEVQLWCSPNTNHPFFSKLAKAHSLHLQVQQGADLGERMHNAFVQALESYESALIIGCDCPSLIHADLEQALSWLAQGKQCVIAPAIDGGYVLIGLNQPQPELFTSMPWGTDQVLVLTRSRLQSLNIESKELAAQWDVDTANDLKRYRENMQPI